MTEDSKLKHDIHTIIFEAETSSGKRFDKILLFLILLSIAAVALETVPWIASRGGAVFLAIEWIVTVLFTIEYGLRIYSVRNRWAYVVSFWGLVDLLAILPTYISLFVVGAGPLLTIRGLRLLRVFRIYRLHLFIEEAANLKQALLASARKITVFFTMVITIVIITGSVMFMIEGPENGFTSIPKGVYWSIVTLTTVGYGDITPQTAAGQIFSAFLMILGYAILAVPTGIVSSELTAHKMPNNTEQCRNCMVSGHPPGAKYCYRCSESL